MSYQMGEPLADDQAYLGAIEVVEYLDHDGDRCYRVRVDGDLPTSTLLGLLRLAEHQVLTSLSDFGDDDRGGV